MSFKVLVAAAIAGTLAQAPAWAQVVREDGQKSIAGVIGGAYAPDASWTFKSAGGDILFASLDAEIYAVRQHEGETGGMEAAAEEGGGGGCEGASMRGLFCIQVLDSISTVVCQATRPAPPPGWQLDPRMACVMPPSATPVEYTIRVSAAGEEGTCGSPANPIPTEKVLPFLLNISLRSVAPTGGPIQQAVAASQNRF